MRTYMKREMAIKMETFKFRMISYGINCVCVCAYERIKCRAIYEIHINCVHCLSSSMFDSFNCTSLIMPQFTFLITASRNFFFHELLTTSQKNNIDISESIKETRGFELVLFPTAPPSFLQLKGKTKHKN